MALKQFNIIEVVESSAISGNDIFPKNTIITFYNDTSKIKIADGKTPFNSLSAIGGGGGGITPDIQAALDLKSNIASPTFTGTVVLPATTSIGTVTNTEIGYLDNVTSPIQTQLNAKSNSLITINTQTANYTLVLADADKLVNMNVASANTLTIPLNSTVAFPIGTQIVVSQEGAGQVTLTPTGGVTLNSAGGKLKTNVQYSTVTLIKKATDVWLVSGDLVA